MIVTPIKTDKILPGSLTLFDVLDKHLSEVKEKSVVVISSKLVAICEARFKPMDSVDKQALIEQEADLIVQDVKTKFGSNFTITNNTLIRSAGIDESNGNNNYILWPKDSQKTANQVREYLRQRFSLKNLGLLITDSTSTPLRLGTSGITLAFSGFKPLNDYRGQPDLFGKPLEVTRANVADGLSVSGVLVMGEGSEQTPIALIEDVPFVQFQDSDPSAQDLEFLNTPLDEDVFAPFITSVRWQKGGRGN
jgi:putative folate metabolism gamma-glutamate ligase